jgi:phenylacetate-coenzyme A ligase PaaK-like adenylate-forming protein
VLAELVSFARDRSPWHAERLAGLDPLGLTPEGLHPVPVMTKSDLMANWDRIVTDPRLRLVDAQAHLEALDRGGPLLLGDRYLVMTTGGSTGEPGVFCWAAEEHASWWACMNRWRLAGGGPPPGRLVTIGARSKRHASAAMPALANAIGVPLDQPMSAIVERLNALQPDALFIGAGSMVGPLAEAAAAGDLRINVHSIMTGGDAMAAGAADAAHAVFGVRPVVTYPTTDVGQIAAGVPGEEALYVNDDVLIVEPVDEHDEPAAGGGPAHHLLITSLHQRTLPLIRYRIDDRVTIAPPDLRYPGFSRVTAMDGRSSDLFRYSELIVHPHAVRTVLSRHPRVTDYQVRQTRRGVHIAIVSSEPIDVESLRRAISKALAAAGLRRPEVEVDRVQALPRTPAGKRVLFVPFAP